MAMFNSYVKLPEGTSPVLRWYPKKMSTSQVPTWEIVRSGHRFGRDIDKKSSTWAMMKCYLRPAVSCQRIATNHSLNVNESLIPQPQAIEVNRCSYDVIWYDMIWYDVSSIHIRYDSLATNDLLKYSPSTCGSRTSTARCAEWHFPLGSGTVPFLHCCTCRCSSWRTPTTGCLVLEKGPSGVATPKISQIHRHVPIFSLLKLYIYIYICMIIYIYIYIYIYLYIYICMYVCMYMIIYIYIYI